MNMRATRAIILWTTAMLFSAVPIARGAGVTIITHGFSGNVTDWIIPMAAVIPDYDLFPGTNFSCYVMSVASDYSVSISRIGGVGPLVIDSGEIIIKLDWSQLADTVGNSTTDIAQSVVPSLLSTTFVSELGGRSLAEFPIHLIGHSRGGSVVSEMARLLGAQGVWVDHLTTLDPHPVTGFPYYDAEVYLYWNTLFADNYWQTNPDFSCPNGESIFGAYNRYLSDLQNGYSCDHSDTHLWYHGTIDWFNTPTTDTQATITSSERSTWWTSYEAGGLFAGFNWSLIGGGNRLSTDEPAGAGNGKIRDGYNQSWDFGAGISVNRYALPSNNGAWPNIIKFDFFGSNTVTAGDSVSMKYFFKFGSSASQTATVQVYLDRDANPYDGNSGQVAQYTESGAGTNSLGLPRTVAFSTSNTPPGQYYVFAKITYGTHSRYLTAPGRLIVRDGNPPTVSITNPTSAKTYTNAQTVTISANATDNVAVASVVFYDGATLKGTDTTAPYSYDWSFTGADNGAHSWTARAYDGAGNASTSTAVALTVSIDIAPPTVAMTSPTNGQNFTTASITVSGTASDSTLPSSGVAAVEVRVNAGSWSNATGTTSWTKTVTLTNCGNTVEARSRDNVTNYSTILSNYVFYTPPNIVPNTPSNVSPANGATNVVATPTLQASAFSDPDPVCVGDLHASSQWQVFNSAGSVVVADSGTDTVNKVTWLVPTNKLYYGSNYQWQVRYRDSRNGWSTYSTKFTFSTGGPLLTGTKQGTNIVFKWPTNALGFTLLWSTNLASGVWNTTTPPAVIVSGQYTVTNGLTNAFKFYHLKKP